MKVSLYSGGNFIGTCNGIQPETGIIVYMDRYFAYNAVGNYFEQVDMQRIHAIEYAPPKVKDDEPELPFTEGEI